MERNDGEGGGARSQGIELRERSFAGVFSHSEQTRVICVLRWLSLETLAHSASLLMDYLSKTLSIAA